MLVNVNVRDRIALIRFIMIFGMVVLHTPEYVPLAELGSGGFDVVKAFFQSALFRTTVPVLTFLSGYLLFGSGLDRKPGQLASKKFASLVVPFLCFNLPLLVVAVLADGLFQLRLGPQLVGADAASWLNAAFGLTNSPINYPLNFLRDMVVLMFLAPLLGSLIRSAPLLGGVLISLIFLNDLEGVLVLRGAMPIAFYMGGVAAVYRWNPRCLDRHAGLCLAALLAVCLIVIHFRVTNTTMLHLVAPFLVWPASALLVDTAFGRWCVGMSKYSFFMFVAHAPLLLATWLVYKKLGEPIPYPLYWTLAPLVTAACLFCAHSLAHRVAPRAFAVMLGKRAAGPTRAAAQLRPAPRPAVSSSTRTSALYLDADDLEVQGNKGPPSAL